MLTPLFTRNRAALYEAERHQAELTRLAAESARADDYLIGLFVLFLLALCCA